MLKIENLLVKIGQITVEVSDLLVRRGEYMVLLGPSGVGKTLLLYSIVGIVRPVRGKILLDGKDITYEKPEKRNIALVPQNFALFPHMSIYDNIAYGLRVRGVPENVIREKVLEISRMLRIEHVLDRKPSQISAGEAQRAALARALIVRPSVLLLDEPLANLDPETKMRAIELLKLIHRSANLVTLHVTHDICEALLLADKIAYMYEGKVVFVGEPDEFLRTSFARPYVRLLASIDNIINLRERVESR